MDFFSHFPVQLERHLARHLITSFLFPSQCFLGQNWMLRKFVYCHQTSIYLFTYVLTFGLQLCAEVSLGGLDFGRFCLICECLPGSSLTQFLPDGNKSLGSLADSSVSQLK